MQCFFVRFLFLAIVDLCISSYPPSTTACITPHIETTTHLVQSLAATQLKYFVLFSCIFFFFSLDKLRAQLVLPFFLVLFGGVSSPRPNFKKTTVPCCRHCPHVRFERQLSTNAVFIWFLFSSSAGKLSIMASGNEEVSPNTTGTTRPREYTEDDDEQILKKQRRYPLSRCRFSCQSL